VRFPQAIFSVPTRTGTRTYTTQSGLPFGRIKAETLVSSARLRLPSRSLAFALSGFPLRSDRDRRIASGVRLLRPNRGPAPRQAVFLFGPIVTDASL
jgi:hypothetical protein